MIGRALSKMFTRRSLPERDPFNNFWFMSMAHARRTSADILVDPQKALSCSTVCACVSLRSGTIASLPKHVYERTGAPRGTRMRPDHWLYPLLHDRVNPWTTSFDWGRTTVLQLDLFGNSYWWIQRGAGNRPEAFWNLEPQRTTTEIRDRQLVHVYRDTHGREHIYPSQDVLHFRDMSLDGLVGMSRVQLVAEAIGLALAAEKYAALFYANHAVLNGALVTDEPLSEEDAKLVKQRFLDAQGGDKRHSIALLHGGLKYEEFGTKQRDAQYLETRKFAVAEISRVWGVPLSLVNDSEGLPRATTEQLSMDFKQHGIAPTVENMEQQLNLKLLTPREGETIFIKFNVDSMLRADLKTRYEAYMRGRQAGILSADEARDLENLPPLPDELGRTWWVPVNVTAIGGPAVPPSPAVDGEADTRSAACGCGAGHPHETRSTRAVPARLRLRGEFLPAIRQAAERLVKREARELLAAAKRYRGGYADHSHTHRDSLDTWLAGFFGDTTPELARDMLGPIFDTYAQSVGARAAEEIGAAGWDSDAFLQAYIDTFGERHSADMRRAVERALAEAADPQTALERLTSLWIDGSEGQLPKGDSIAHEEAVRLGDAVTRGVWSQAGVTKYVWRNAGQTCPICKELEGKTVGVDQPFAAEGDLINPNKEKQPREEDVKISLKIRRNVFHPPLHSGCDCYLSTE